MFLKNSGNIKVLTDIIKQINAIDLINCEIINRLIFTLKRSIQIKILSHVAICIIASFTIMLKSKR